jgi:transcription termination/antitermination protein NusG
MSSITDDAHSEVGGEAAITPRWYAVQVASGCENKVKLDLQQRIQSFDVVDRIIQIEIPQSPIIRLKKDGTKQHAEEKVFPGYVLVRMAMDDDAWQVVKNTPNVINFVGAEQKRGYGRGRGHVKPLPLSHGEVDRIFQQAAEQEAVVKTDLNEGDKIVVLAGPLRTLRVK